MNTDDFDLSGFDDNNRGKKKAEGGRKGKRVERALCKVLNERFGKEFSRTVGSGNRWSHVANMPKHARETFTGDICCPENFAWVFECKGGYEGDIDLSTIFNGLSQIWRDWLKDLERDSEFAKKKPVLAWKRDRKPWIACVQTEDLPDAGLFPFRMIYNKWTIILLEDWLKTHDNDYFFNK